MRKLVSAFGKLACWEHFVYVRIRLVWRGREGSSKPVLRSWAWIFLMGTRLFDWENLCKRRVMESVTRGAT